MLGTATTNSQRRFAGIMLLIATLCWGMGFAWAKNVGEAANHAAGQPNGSPLGPIFILAIRFLTAGLLWAIFFPQSRHGWSWRSLGYGCIVGVMICSGLVLQHLGLDRASEAVTAFLTNLTVVLVPLIIAGLTIGAYLTKREQANEAKPGAIRALFPANLLIACALSLVGIYLLTGAKAGGLSSGEVLGMLCAVAFSIELLLLNVLVPRDSVYRLTLAMFLFCGIVCGLVAIAMPGFGQINYGSLFSRSVTIQLVLLTLFTTLVAFGLMNTFQPQVDPRRAAIIYLFEPIAAAFFAWMTQPNASMTRLSLIGAGLILLANVVAELKWSRRPAAARLQAGN